MSHFIFRGPLPASSQLFCGREEELATLEELCSGTINSYAIVYGARQSGKTSLLIRLQERLSGKQIVCARVDFQGIPKALTNQAFSYIAHQVHESLQIQKTISSEITSLQLKDYLCQTISFIGDKKLVLMIEEFGALTKEVRIDIANVFRSFFTNRYERANCQLAQMFVIFAGSIEMFDLATVELSPLNNICERLYLPDLSKEDAVGLIQAGLERGGTTAEIAAALGNLVYEKVHGYPSLTQRFGNLLEQQRRKNKGLSTDDVALAALKILQGDDVLQHICNTLNEEKLFPASNELLEKKIRFSRIDPEMARLELIGFVMPDDAFWRMRNPLFESALKSWIEEGIYQEDAPSIKEKVSDLSALAEFTKLIIELGSMVRATQVNLTTQDEMAEKIKQIELQLESGQAKKASVIETLSHLSSIVGSTATLGTAIPQITPMIQQAIQLAVKLFP